MARIEFTAKLWQPNPDMGFWTFLVFPQDASAKLPTVGPRALDVHKDIVAPEFHPVGGQGPSRRLLQDLAGSCVELGTMACARDDVAGEAALAR